METVRSNLEIDEEKTDMSSKVHGKFSKQFINNINTIVSQQIHQQQFPLDSKTSVSSFSFGKKGSYISSNATKESIKDVPQSSPFSHHKAESYNYESTNAIDNSPISANNHYENVSRIPVMPPSFRFGNLTTQMEEKYSEICSKNSTDKYYERFKFHPMLKLSNSVELPSKSQRYECMPDSFESLYSSNESMNSLELTTSNKESVQGHHFADVKNITQIPEKFIFDLGLIKKTRQQTSDTQNKEKKLLKTKRRFENSNDSMSSLKSTTSKESEDHRLKGVEKTTEIPDKFIFDLELIKKERQQTSGTKNIEKKLLKTKRGFGNSNDSLSSLKSNTSKEFEEDRRLDVQETTEIPDKFTFDLELIKKKRQQTSGTKNIEKKLLKTKRGFGNSNDSLSSLKSTISKESEEDPHPDVQETTEIPEKFVFDLELIKKKRQQTSETNKTEKKLHKTSKGFKNDCGKNTPDILNKALKKMKNLKKYL